MAKSGRPRSGKQARRNAQRARARAKAKARAEAKARRRAQALHAQNVPAAGAPHAVTPQSAPRHPLGGQPATVPAPPAPPAPPADVEPNGSGDRDPHEPPAGSPVPMPRRIFVVAMLWTIALVAVFGVWITIGAVRDAVPHTLGPLPVETIWFGAVGGLLISLTGIYDHNDAWNPRFNYWHYTRPLLGAFIGVLGCLVLLVLTEASTTRAIVANATFYSVTALVIGYREETFRTLVMRLTDTLLASDGGVPHGNDRAPAPRATRQRLHERGVR